MHKVTGSPPRTDSCTKPPEEITLLDLSQRQQQCLEWLYYWTEVSPQRITITGLSTAMGMLQHHGAKFHLDRLGKYGLVTRVPGMPGTVRPTEHGLKLGRRSAHKCDTEKEMREVARQRKKAKRSAKKTEKKG